jgi:RNA polymerase sigma-70 factor (ECF subfamily)
MNTLTRPTLPELETYRRDLRLLANRRLHRRLRAKLDPSDVVQETFLRAHKSHGKFRGGTGEELAAWLRRILANCLARVARDFYGRRRDVFREQSLQPVTDGSSGDLEAGLASIESSPSERAIQRERVLRLAEALTELPEDQREVVVLHHCHGWTLSRVARHMDRSFASVAGLLRRGLARLRETLKDDGGE